MTRQYKLSNFAPEYFRALKIVLKNGFHHVEYTDVNDCAADRFKFYRLRNALLNDESVDRELRELANYLTISWRKGSRCFEMFDTRKKHSYLSGLANSNDLAEQGVQRKTFDSSIDEDILNYPLNPEDDGEGFLE